MIFDTYEIKARYFPAVINLTLLYIIWYPTFSDYLSLKMEHIVNATVANFMSHTILLAYVYFIFLFSRYVSKTLFERGPLYTSRMLSLKNQELDKKTNKIISLKIKEFYNMSLPTIDFENKNKEDANKQREMIISQIRNDLRGNKILYNRNIEYGFARNLRGGTFISLITFLLLDVFFYFSQNQILFNSCMLGLCIFFTLFLCASFMQNKASKDYAYTLFEQFISLKK